MNNKNHLFQILKFMIGTKLKTMDGDSSDKQKSRRNSLPNDSDISEPPRVRHIGFQTDAINQRLLDYNVNSIWISVCILIIVTFIL